MIWLNPPESSYKVEWDLMMCAENTKCIISQISIWSWWLLLSLNRHETTPGMNIFSYSTIFWYFILLRGFDERLKFDLLIYELFAFLEAELRQLLSKAFKGPLTLMQQQVMTLKLFCLWLYFRSFSCVISVDTSESCSWHSGHNFKAAYDDVEFL